MNLASNTEALTIAAIENAKSTKYIADIQTILSDLMQNSKIQESKVLAKNVQGHLYRQVMKDHTTVRNRGIKKAPFYVLLGAQMPAVMIQAGFITNHFECKLLSTDKYQEEISIGIVEGIRVFMEERRTQPVNSADPKSRSAD